MKASITVMLRGPADLRVVSKKIEPKDVPQRKTTVEVPGFGPVMVESIHTDYEDHIIDVSLKAIDFEYEEDSSKFIPVYKSCIKAGWKELEKW